MTGGGKLGRTETVTVRLDPRINALCEMAARVQRRTKSSFIEGAIIDALSRMDPQEELRKQDEALERLARQFLPSRLPRLPDQFTEPKP